jgi:phosphoribosylformylglycinamidine synthase
VIFRYCDDEGRLTSEANPNGSARNIAGICNRGRNVLGLMPHPERCSESILGNAEGLAIFKSIAASHALERRPAAGAPLPRVLQRDP